MVAVQGAGDDRSDAGNGRPAAGRVRTGAMPGVDAAGLGESDLLVEQGQLNCAKARLSRQAPRDQVAIGLIVRRQL